MTTLCDVTGKLFPITYVTWYDNLHEFQNVLHLMFLVSWDSLCDSLGRNRNRKCTFSDHKERVKQGKQNQQQSK